MKLFQKITKKMLIPLAVAGVMFSGVTSAEAASITSLETSDVSSPSAIGVPQWMYFGINYDSCVATQNSYKNQYAHIITYCADTTTFWQHAVGIGNNYGFQFQWQ